MWEISPRCATATRADGTVAAFASEVALPEWQEVIHNAAIRAPPAAKAENKRFFISI
jgi:hypothetical protein